MSKSFVIKTKRLTLFPFTQKEITKKYLSWLNNKDIMRFSRHRDFIHAKKSCTLYLQTFDWINSYIWAIKIKKNNKNIGNINAYVKPNKKSASIGILIGDIENQKKGYAFEAWIAVANYLFENTQIKEISAGTLVNNLPMLRLMEKLKMKEDNKFQKKIIWEGKRTKVIKKLLLKNEWIKIHGKQY